MGRYLHGLTIFWLVRCATMPWNALAIFFTLNLNLAPNNSSTAPIIGLYGLVMSIVTMKGKQLAKHSIIFSYGQVEIFQQIASTDVNKRNILQS